MQKPLEWKPLELSEKDMEWIAYQREVARRIAEELDVPPQLIDVLSNHSESEMSQAKADVLHAWVVAFEETQERGKL